MVRGDVLLVRLGVEEVVHAGVGRLDLDQPALLPGVLREGLEVLHHVGVDLDDLTAEGGVEVGDGLDGLDLAKGLALLDLAADLGQVTVHEVSLVAVGELLHGEVGDADNDEVTLELGPFMGVEVLAVVRAHGSLTGA